MSGFSFGNIKVSSKKQTLGLKVNNNVILADRDSTADSKSSLTFTPVILTDEIYDTYALKAIEKFLNKCGLYRYKIVSAINCNLDQNIIKAEGKIKFYKNNRSQFYNYIPPHAPIITVGAALYSVIMEDDVYPTYVQQIIFGKSNFWFSEDLTSANGHWIYPIESFRDIFAKGFQDPVDSYKTKLAQIQIGALIKNGVKPTPRYPKLIKHKIETKEQFIKEFYEPSRDRKDEILAWDLETSGLSFLKDRIGCITLSFDGVEGWYIPWSIMDDECKTLLDKIFSRNKLAGANLKFDTKFLWKNGIPSARIDEDVIALGHCLDETRSNSLKTLAFLYSEYGGYERPLDKIKEHLGKGFDISYIDDIPEEILWDYAVMDAIVTRRVLTNLHKTVDELDSKYPNSLSSKKIKDYYYERRIPAENMYSKIEYTGVYVDKKALDDLRLEMNTYLRDVRSKLAESFEVPVDFDWTSNSKLGKLIESKGWEEFGRSKAGDYLVGDFQLTRWSKTHKEAKLITEMKSVQTLLNTFVGDETSNSVIADFLGHNDEEGSKGWTKMLVYHPEDDSWRMHPNFRPMYTDSGRSRCTSPNMQQIPSHSNWATKIKRCIVTPNNDEYYMVTIDYSSLQLRLACIDQREEDFLREVLRRPKVDIHSATGFKTLAQGRKFDISTIDVDLENGEHKTFLGLEEVVTSNRKNVLGSELEEGDLLNNIKITRISRLDEYREITEEEFKRQKTQEPFATMRQTAKSENFLLIFGGSAKVLSDSALETAWDEAQCDEYIETNRCEEKLEQARKIYRGESEVKLKNIAVCMNLRENFFKGYRGLWNRIGREKDFAATHGYVRTVFGKVRNVIELFLRGEYDNQTISGALRNLENICANHPAQNMEACIRGRAQYETQCWLARNNYKTKTWNEIHDSADFWIKKEEIKPVLSHIKHIFERKIPELANDWVPLVVDCEVSDLPEGDYYKGGRPPEAFGVAWDTCKYEDPDPFNVELSEDLEREYFEQRADYWKSIGKEDPLKDRIEKHLRK